MQDKRPLTIFLDIDGCILRHIGNPDGHAISLPQVKLLSGTKEKLRSWIMKDYKIILVTGRKECTRQETESQLRLFGITWDQLIMGIGGGCRVLINDYKPDSTEKSAVAYTIPRNKGLISLIEI